MIPTTEKRRKKPLKLTLKLYLAIKEKDPVKVKELLQKGANPYDYLTV